MLKSGQTSELIYNMVMKRFLKLTAILFFVLFTTQTLQAEEYRVLVLPDNIQFSSTNHLIYPDSSVIFASDTINEIKKDGRVQTVSMTEIRDELRKNQKLNILTNSALKEFKYNYNIPFVDFKAIASKFSTNKVLVITSQTDVQNFILTRSIWDILNFPGAPVVRPTYKLSTYAALIDVDKELVLWQNTYYKNISALENRIVAQSFAPATEQLEKIKSYSTFLLSPQIANMVQSKILPPPILPINGTVTPVKLNMDVVNPESVLQEENNELKNKPMLRSRTKFESNGAIINDI